MFRATDPRLNGIWLQWSCDEPIYLSSLCQASPIYQNRHVNQMLLSPYRTETFYCPSGFQLGTTGLLKVKGQSMAKLSQPMCYRVFNHVTKMNWAVSLMSVFLQSKRRELTNPYIQTIEYQLSDLKSNRFTQDLTFLVSIS